jgi:hypothetical protein
VLESVSFFLGGKKCQKIVNIRVMGKDLAEQQRLFSGTIVNSERSNATSQCIWIQIFLFVIVIVLPICSTC